MTGTENGIFWLTVVIFLVAAWVLYKVTSAFIKSGHSKWVLTTKHIKDKRTAAIVFAVSVALVIGLGFWIWGLSGSASKKVVRAIETAEVKSTKPKRNSNKPYSFTVPGPRNTIELKVPSSGLESSNLVPAGVRVDFEVDRGSVRFYENGNLIKFQNRRNGQWFSKYRSGGSGDIDPRPTPWRMKITTASQSARVTLSFSPI